MNNNAFTASGKVSHLNSSLLDCSALEVNGTVEMPNYLYRVIVLFRCERGIYNLATNSDDLTCCGSDHNSSVGAVDSKRQQLVRKRSA